jgi:ribulose-phosphate 3-epimerase
MPLIAPSLLSANFGNLSKDIDMVNQSEADWFHLDVMDGVFVPNITFGIPVIKAIKKLAKKPLDVHLMITNPDRFISAFKDAGADVLTVHFEACVHLHRTVTAIRQAGMKAGVAINPHTPVLVLTDIISETDLVCMMSVNPGFGGQKFIENTYHKISEFKQLIHQRKSSALLEIDGGVDFENAAKLIKADADVLVAGNTVFSSSDPSKAISRLKHVEKTLSV